MTSNLDPTIADKLGPVALVLMMASLPGYVSLGLDASLPADRPNFILILTDDQRYDAVGFLHAVLETPYIDRLAAQGVFFPNAFVTTSICPSSRATILTGLHEQTHILGNLAVDKRRLAFLTQLLPGGHVQ